MKVSGNVTPTSNTYTDELGDFMYFIEMQIGEKGYCLNEDFIQTKISALEALCELCGDPHEHNNFTKFYLEPTFSDDDDIEEEDYLEEEGDEG